MQQKGTDNMRNMCYFYARIEWLLGVSQVEIATISNRGLYELKVGDKSLLHRDRDRCSARVPIRGDRSGDQPLYYDNVCFCWRRHNVCYQLARNRRTSSRSDV